MNSLTIAELLYVSVAANILMSWVTVCAASIMVKCPEAVIIWLAIS